MPPPALLTTRPVDGGKRTTAHARRPHPVRRGCGGAHCIKERLAPRRSRRRDTVRAPGGQGARSNRARGEAALRACASIAWSDPERNSSHARNNSGLAARHEGSRHGRKQSRTEPDSLVETNETEHLTAWCSSDQDGVLRWQRPSLPAPAGTRYHERTVMSDGAIGIEHGTRAGECRPVGRVAASQSRSSRTEARS